MSIIIERISKTYCTGAQENQVLKNVSLEVPDGVVFALTGPNGSGKTTLLKILATLVLPSTGTARIAGADIIASPVAARSHLALVYEADRTFYQVLSVEENLHFYGRLFGIPGGERRARIEKLLTDFDLLFWRGVKVHHCSSGIRQRAAIARALLTGPDVLLVDEPSRSLDAGSKEHIAARLSEYTAVRRAACIMVTHDTAWASTFATASGTLIDGMIRSGTI